MMDNNGNLFIDAILKLLSLDNCNIIIQSIEM